VAWFVDTYWADRAGARKLGFADYIRELCFLQCMYGVRDGVELLPPPRDCSEGRR
jgi:hypothetical protein